MKFDNNTLKILKNFASINPSILFRPGNTISTVSPSKTILAKAKIDQELESQFAIYDLSRFLGTLSLFTDPDLVIKSKSMEIRQDNRKLNYTFTEPSLIVSPPDKNIELDNPEIKFSISATELQELMKALSVLSMPEVAIIGDESKITIKGINTKNPTGDVYSLEIGETTDKFKMIFNSDNLKIIPGDYKIEISSSGISHWSGSIVDYWIMTESDSKFG